MFSSVLTLSLAILSPQLHAETKANSRSGSAYRTEAPCDLLQPTPENSTRVDWDRQQANIDLMTAEMKAGKYNAKTVKVAVVDGACNYSPKVQNRIDGNIVMAEDVPVVAPPHCNSVASRVTLGSPGTQIKNWPTYETVTALLADKTPRPGQTPQNKEKEQLELARKEIMIAVTKACAEGYDVINLSSTYVGGPVIAVEQQVQATLESRGCILVQASGNYQSDQAALDLRANDKKRDELLKHDFLTVGANTIDGERVGYSAYAVLRAPGHEVPAINNDGETELVSGTSFSAPTVSAIAKNVLTVLRASPRTKGLHKDEQRHLAIRILKAAVVNDSIDGYRAVILAQNIGKSGNEATLNTKDSIKAAMTDEAVNIRTPGNCQYLACAAKRACYNDKRKMMSLLPDTVTSTDLEDMRNTAQSSSSPLLAKQWTRALSSSTSGTPRQPPL